MKKIISLILCLVCIASLFIPTCSAVSIEKGTDVLNRQFKNGSYSADYDYVCYSPVKSEDDTTKYPLMIWLHGMRSGEYARAQLQWYHFSNWASEEYQSRFVNAGGCFLLAPRVASAAINSWDSTMCSDLKGLIDAYIEKNKDNIDTTRIYISGYSTGGSMVWNMVTSYPDFFAAAMPLAAITQPSYLGMRKLKDVSIWVFSSDSDPYIINKTSNVKPKFEYLAGITNRPDGLRLTSFTQAVFADGTRKTGSDADHADHYIWEAVTFDMFMADGETPYLYATTIDSSGNEITLDTPGIGVIDWLSRQTTKSEDSGIPEEFIAKIRYMINRVATVIKSFIKIADFQTEE